MGDNDSAMTCPTHMRRAGFHLANGDMSGRTIEVGMTNSIAFTKGDLVIDDASGGATNGSITTIDLTVWKGIAATTRGSVTSLANAGVKLAVYCPVFHSDMFWAQAVDQPDSGDTDLVATFTDKDTVNLAAGATEGDVGFKVLGFDEATTYYAVFGCFVVMGA